MMFFYVTWCLVLLLTCSCQCMVVIRKHGAKSQADLFMIHKGDDSKCRPLTIPACKKLGYNETRIPSVMKMHRAIDVNRFLDVFEKEKCSRDLLFFTCMMYNPICLKNHLKRVLPCKSLCQNVKRDCKQSMKKFGIEWPTELDCSQLPDYETDVCIKPNSIVTRQNFANMNADTKVVNKSSCRPTCHLDRPTLQRYEQFQMMDYAFEGRLVSKTKTSAGNFKLQFKVRRIFKAGVTSIVKFGTIDIWSSSPCLCVNLEYDGKYYILGAESKDKEGGRMILDGRTIIMKKTYYVKQLLKAFRRRSRHQPRVNKPIRWKKLKKRFPKLFKQPLFWINDSF